MKIFFVRSHADLDFFLPLLSEFKDSYLVIYNKFIISENCKRILIINKIKCTYIFNGVFSKHISSLIKLKKKLNYMKFNLICDYLTNKIIKIELNKIIFLLSKGQKVQFFFDHNNSDFIKDIISFFKINLKNKKEFVALPHGINVISNYITESHMLDFPNRKDYSFFDKVICSDNYHYKNIKCKNKKILFPLRYTKFWQKKFLDNSYNFKINNSKKNILIVHSKFSGNFHKTEFFRILKLILSTQKYNIILKLHPRITKKEKNEIIKNCSDITILNHDVINMTHASDLIVFFQSSAIVDAILFKKTIIYPKFASSNLIDKNILSYCFIAESPDEFLKYIKYKIGKNKNNYKNKLFFDYKKLLLSWKNELHKF